MAIIPKKSKTSNVSSSINLDIALVIFSIYIFADKFFSNLISSRLVIPFSVLIILLAIYMILGNKKNKGHIGYERVLIFLRFKIYQFLEFRSKHIYIREVLKHGNENKKD